MRSHIGLAKHERGSIPTDSTVLRLRRDERLFATAPGAMVEVCSRQGAVHTMVVAQGSIVVTDQRVAFVGPTNREWSFDKLQGHEHVGADMTLLRVTNRQKVSGFVYRDAIGLNRLLLDLAIADSQGERAHIAAQLRARLAAHDGKRPPNRRRLRYRQSPTALPLMLTAIRRVRQALDELAAINAAQPRRVGASNERTWVPAPVDRVLAGIRRRRRHDTVTDRWRRHLAAVNGVDRFLIDNARVRHLATRALARQRIAQLAAAEQYEHLALNTEEVFSADAVAVARPLDTGLRNRGLRLRSIGLTPSDGDRALANDTDLGDEYREADTL